MKYLYRDVRSTLWLVRIGGAGQREVRIRLAEALWSFAARHLPKKLTYHATIRAGVHATTGRYGSTVVPEVTFMDVLKRWDEDHRIEASA